MEKAREPRVLFRPPLRRFSRRYSRVELLNRGTPVNQRTLDYPRRGREALRRDAARR